MGVVLGVSYGVEEIGWYDGADMTAAARAHFPDSDR